ncbi:hypothetical protein GBA52_025110 [Prunus armeniaca]|nr:hypothetical protein GBA52_025110 [Prunus armeniaca]
MVGLNNSFLRRAKKFSLKPLLWPCLVMPCHALNYQYPCVKKLKLLLLGFGGSHIKRNTTFTGFVGQTYLNSKRREAWAFVISNALTLPYLRRLVGGSFIIRALCLLACLLHDKYFAGAFFLSATSQKSSSWGWKGILQGRRLLESGLRWRIGDGIKVQMLYSRRSHSHLQLTYQSVGMSRQANLALQLAWSIYCSFRL